MRSWEIFWILCRISAVSVGGGMAMLPLMQREFVEKRHVISENDMVDIVALTQSSPGLIAINMGVLLGYRIHGIPGLIAGALGMALPPFLAILLLASVLTKLQDSEDAAHIFLGVRAAVSALVLVSAIKLFRQSTKGTLAKFLAAFGFLGMVIWEVNAVYLILAGAILGIASSAISWVKAGKTKQENPPV